VVAAIAASLETTESDQAIVSKNDARPGPEPGQRHLGPIPGRGIEENLYQIASDTPGPKTAAYAAKAADEAPRARRLSKKATGLEEAVQAAS